VRRRSELGQATVEWVGLVLLVSLVLGALAALAPTPADGRSLGGALAHRIACAARGGCDDGDRALARVLGGGTAGLVRRHAPNLAYEPGERSLPVDPRECRERSCARAPDDRDLDAHRTRSGARATAFAHVIRRGGRTYLQYWLYYPDSNTSVAGADRLWRRSGLLQLAGRVLTGSPAYPGYHRDDWEGYAVRIDPNGDVWARATSHGHWQACKQRRCRNRWLRSRGWTRVSRGSHAGHLPDRPERERSSTADGLRVLPLEAVERGRYRRADPGVAPPWEKEAHVDPESPRS
jgi:hypothetical protein